MKHTLIGKSKALKNIIKQINTLVFKKDDILIIGEKGCGKSVIAKNIHAACLKGKENIPPIILNPADIDQNKLSEILENHRESLTETNDNADRHFSDNPNGCTIIIEEIERASFKNQEKVVRFLHQLHTRRNLSYDTPVHVRVIVTVHTDPVKLAQKKQLVVELADLLSNYTRLFVPPLRERKEDIPHLVEHFVVESCKKIGIPEPVIDINAISILVDQPWKNNINELKTVIERSVMFSTNGLFTLPQDMVDENVKVTRMLRTILSGEGEQIDESLDTIERGLLYTTLERFNFNISKSAEYLGMNKEKLCDRVNQLSLVRVSK
jgi:DNA-binding NtrC family response regulator